MVCPLSLALRLRIVAGGSGLVNGGLLRAGDGNNNKRYSYDRYKSKEEGKECSSDKSSHLLQLGCLITIVRGFCGVLKIVCV